MDPERLPAELRRIVADGGRIEVAEGSVALLLSRRQFLKAVGVILAAVAVPITWTRQAAAAARGRFLTRPELVTLEALCDRIIPPDRDPGARALGAATFIDRFLAAFDHRGVPTIFAGGPFSNRNPFPDTKTGTPSHRRPKNSFKHFIPLTRVQELRWRAELFGSAAVRGADFNDATLGPLRGLRDIYRQGLKAVDDMARAMKGAAFARLSAQAQDTVLAAADAAGIERDRRRGATFIDLVTEHTLEGCFALPEYGGNHATRGWVMIGLEGDDQPLGYSIFSTSADGYNERPDHPMSTPNPDELVNGVVVPRAISADAKHVQDSIIMLTSIFGE